MKPIVKGPMTDADIMNWFSNPDTISDMAMVLYDWVEASKYLTELNAPEETATGNNMTMKERIQWLLDNK